MIDKEAQFFIMLQTYLNIAPNKTNKNWICNHNMCSSERYSFSYKHEIFVYCWTGLDRRVSKFNTNFPPKVPEYTKHNRCWSTGITKFLLDWFELQHGLLKTEANSFSNIQTRTHLSVSFSNGREPSFPCSKNQ